MQTGHQEIKKHPSSISPHKLSNYHQKCSRESKYQLRGCHASRPGLGVGECGLVPTRGGEGDVVEVGVGYGGIEVGDCVGSVGYQ